LILVRIYENGVIIHKDKNKDPRGGKMAKKKRKLHLALDKRDVAENVSLVLHFPLEMR